jgi:hypothetical protein
VAESCLEGVANPTVSLHHRACAMLAVLGPRGPGPSPFSSRKPKERSILPTPAGRTSAIEVGSRYVQTIGGGMADWTGWGIGVSSHRRTLVWPNEANFTTASLPPDRGLPTAPPAVT